MNWKTRNIFYALGGFYLLYLVYKMMSRFPTIEKTYEKALCIGFSILFVVAGVIFIFTGFRELKKLDQADKEAKAEEQTETQESIEEDAPAEIEETAEEAAADAEETAEEESDQTEEPEA